MQPKETIQQAATGAGTEFTPSNTLQFVTNHLPKAPVGDSAFWERIQLIPLEPWARLSGMREKGGDANALVRRFLEMCLASDDAVDLRAMQLHQSFVSWCRESKGLSSEKILNLRSFNVNCRELGVLLRRLYEKHEAQGSAL